MAAPCTCAAQISSESVWWAGSPSTQDGSSAPRAVEGDGNERKERSRHVEEAEEWLRPPAAAASPWEFPCESQPSRGGGRASRSCGADWDTRLSLS